MNIEKFTSILTPEQMVQIIKQQNDEIEMLREAIKNFVDKNFVGGSKADRPDYTQMVSCKDIWDLREIVREK